MDIFHLSIFHMSKGRFFHISLELVMFSANIGNKQPSVYEVTKVIASGKIKLKHHRNASDCGLLQLSVPFSFGAFSVERRWPNYTVLKLIGQIETSKG